MSASETIFRLAELEIVPEALAAYTALLAEEIEASVRAEPGVLALYALADRVAPNRLRIVEIYASEAAYEAHLETPHFLKYKAATAAMVTSLRLIETDPVILRAKPWTAGPEAG